MSASALPTSTALAHEIHGEGPPLLWAGGMNPVVYENISKQYPRTIANRSVVTFKYRGPVDDQGNDLEQTTEAYAADLLRLLDDLGLDRVHVVGTGGLGAMVMSQLGIAAPFRIAAAALVQGTLRMSIRSQWISQSSMLLREQVGFAASQRLMLAICHTPAYLDEHADDLVSDSWAWLADPEMEKQHRAYYEACNSHDVTSGIHRMTCPTLVVSGDDIDPILGTWAAKEMHAALPDSELVIVPGAPHAISESRAFLDAFDEPVAAFLAKHPVQEGSA